MLYQILGLAGTGKTTALMEKIARRAGQGKECILLVPEQFSSSAEGMVYHTLGEKEGALVEVVSFRTLGERVLKSCGGWGLKVLSDAGRVVYVRRVLSQIGDYLPSFARQRNSTAFCNLCAQTLSELKTAGATPQVLRAVAAQEDNEKFAEIAMIFEAYEAALESSALDPQDQLTLAASKADCGYFSGKACFIDSFDGFTAPEYEMLEQILQHCDDVTVAFCCDEPFQQDELPGLFVPVRRALARLYRLADKTGCKKAVPEILTQMHRPQKPVLAQVNHLLASGEVWEEAPPTQGLWVSRAQDEWEEVRLAAAEMRRLALQGVPYSHMALVCRDVAAYRRVVARQMELFDIPCFMDAPGTIEFTAPVAFLRAALALLWGGVTSASLLALLKTGLCGYGEEEIAAMENYVYTWEPAAAQWRQPFENNPAGLLQDMQREGEIQLAQAEAIRAELVAKVDAFRQGAKGANAAKLSRQLYLLLDHFDGARRADELALRLEEQGQEGYAQQARRAWDLAMDLLDQMARLLGRDAISPLEYDELFLLLVRSTEFASAPQTLECALFSGADRMRLSQPEYVFVLGLCEGEFPMQVGYSGLLSHNDRDALVRGDIAMPGSFENRTMLEDMFFYRALTAPSQGLYLSWPARRAGQAKSLTSSLEPLLETFQPPALELPPEYLAGTPQAAFDLLGLEYRANSPLAASLYAALEQRGSAQLGLLQQVDNPGEFFVRDETLLDKLLGRTLTLSATQTEQYYQCRFSYFMERVLRVKPRRKAQISPLESGTFVHHILEKVLEQAGADFPHCTDDQLLLWAREHADRFIEQHLPQSTRRTAWMLEQIKETTARLVLFMRDAAAQSQFSISALELEIGLGEEALPPLEVDIGQGRKVRVVGKVDRVDTFQQGEKTYLCIVDYKTGSKAFRLEDVNYGSNIQMLVYMQALCENGADRYPNAAPAGVLYLQSDPAPQLGGREGSGKPAFRLNGLLLSDVSILNALDNREQGSFLPVRFSKDGTPYKTSPVIEEEGFSQTLSQVKDLLEQMARGVYGGDFCARPLVKGNSRPCVYCPYRAACRHEDGQNETQMEKNTGEVEA